MTMIFDHRLLSVLDFAFTSSRVFIYIVDMNECCFNDLLLSKLWYCLSDFEKEQALEFHNKSLSNRYIISHSIIKCILSYYLQQSPKEIKFIKNEYGKPFLNHSNIQFNISHSNNMIYYIIGFNNKVGVDIEFNDYIVDIIELSKIVLTNKEIETLNTLSPQKQIKLFYDIWTIKEALVKAIGEGLTYPIFNIETLPIIQGGKITLPNIKENYSRVLYTYSIKSEENYSASIATEVQIKEIIYLEMKSKLNIFNKISSTYLVY